MFGTLVVYNSAMQNCDGIAEFACWYTLWYEINTAAVHTAAIRLGHFKNRVICLRNLPDGTCCTAYIETFLSSNIRRRRLIPSVSTFKKWTNVWPARQYINYTV